MSNNILRQPQLQVETEELKRLRARLLPPYRVILYDDDYNEMNYVVFVLLHCINNTSQAALLQRSVPKRPPNFTRNAYSVTDLPQLSSQNKTNLPLTLPALRYRI